jgi:hypothetical protein
MDQSKSVLLNIQQLKWKELKVKNAKACIGNRLRNLI